MPLKIIARPDRTLEREERAHEQRDHTQPKTCVDEIEKLRREAAKLKAERDILKGRSLLREGRDMRFAFFAKHRVSRRWHGFAKRWTYRGRASTPGFPERQSAH